MSRRRVVPIRQILRLRRVLRYAPLTVNTALQTAAISNRRAVFIITLLVLAHLCVDFYGGILLPLPEPTLMNHLGVSLARVMVIVSGSAILVNVIQPLSGWALPRRRLPWLIVICPALACVVSLIGVTANYFLTGAFLMLSAVGIGLLHPEAAQTVQTLAPKRTGLATSIFMSAGFFGFSIGSLVAGWWGEQYGLRHFWFLLVPGILISALLAFSGILRLSEKHAIGKSVMDATPVGDLPFVLVWSVGVAMATNLGMTYRLLPILLVRRFGAHAQADAGTILFIIGLGGAFGAFIWGALADRFGAGKVLAVIYLAGLPLYYFLLYMTDLGTGMIWAALFGLTIGGTFPLSVVLARKARELSLRLRLGLCIGGAWGIGELSVILATQYIDHFEPNDPAPLENALSLGWLFMSIVVLLSVIISIRSIRKNVS